MTQRAGGELCEESRKTESLDSVNRYNSELIDDLLHKTSQVSKILFSVSLYFLCGHNLHISLSSMPVFCSSVFHATMASTFSFPRSLFSIPQFFMRLWWPWPPLFLVRKSCFLFLSFLCDYCLCFSFLFSTPQFFMRLLPLLFLVLKACFVFLSFLSYHGLHRSFHNATLVRIRFMTLYPKRSSPSVSKSVYYTASARNNIIP